MLLCACITAHPFTRNDKHCGFLGRHCGPSRQELWTGPFPGSRMFKVAKYEMSKQIQQNLDFFLNFFQTMVVLGILSEHQCNGTQATRYVGIFKY